MQRPRFFQFVFFFAVVATSSTLVGQTVPDLKFDLGRFSGYSPELNVKWRYTNPGAYDVGSYGHRGLFDSIIFDETHFAGNGVFSGIPQMTSVKYKGISDAGLHMSKKEIRANYSTLRDPNGVIQTGSDYEYELLFDRGAWLNENEQPAKPFMGIERNVDLSNSNGQQSRAKTIRSYKVKHPDLFDPFQFGSVTRRTDYWRYEGPKTNEQKMESFFVVRKAELAGLQMLYDRYSLTIYELGVRKTEVQAKYSYYDANPPIPGAPLHQDVEKFDLRFMDGPVELHLVAYYDRLGNITKLHRASSWDHPDFEDQFPLVPPADSGEAIAIDLALYHLQLARSHPDTWWSTYTKPELRMEQEGNWGDIMPNSYAQILTPGGTGMTGSAGGDDDDGGDGSDDGLGF